MHCLKCGCETEDSHVFCDACLSKMEKRPVKPGTPVSIYKRANKPSGNHSSKKQKKAEDLLPKLQKENRHLIASVIVLSILLVLTMSGLIFKVYQDFGKIPLGQNYTTVTHTTSETITQPSSQ